MSVQGIVSQWIRKGSLLSARTGDKDLQIIYGRLVVIIGVQQ